MTIHDNFYTNRFNGLTSFYKEGDTLSQANFIAKSVDIHPGENVLDLACGYGRHSIALAQMGCCVRGHDQSQDYIARATHEAQRSGVEVTFEVADMRRLESLDEFDVVLSLSTSLAFYDEATNKDILRRIHRALKPAGRFLYDQGNVFWMASLTANGKQENVKELPDGRIHHHSLFFDANTCVGSSRSVIVDGEEQIEAGWDLRYYTLPEVSALAREIGFEIVRVYGDYDGSQYAVGTARMITAMRKI